MTRAGAHGPPPQIFKHLPPQKGTDWASGPRYSIPVVASAEAGTQYLMKLPDELLLLIVSNLHALRLDQPQSLAFRDSRRETDRQYENYHRRVALHSLCLTSKRLNRLAVPALYNAIIGSATLYGIESLRLVSRTLDSREELRCHVRYVENLLEDCFGNRLFVDLATSPYEFVIDYFAKLAWVIRNCPNIEHLSVISLESHSFTLWGQFLEQTPPSSEKTLLSNIPEGSLRKLQKLAFQTNVSEYSTEMPGTDFNRIYLALLECSSLRELRASGVIGRLRYIIPSQPTFSALQRAEITECTVPLRDVNNFLSVCDGLQHFICHWTFLWCDLTSRRVDLLTNLQRQHMTLQTLCLAANRVGFDSTYDSWVACSSLSQMTKLKTATLCNLFIPNEYCRMDESEMCIAAELPSSLEELTISYTMHQTGLDDWQLVYMALQQLIASCSQYLPRLKKLVVHYEEVLIMQFTDELTRSFKEKGIQFEIVQKLDYMDMLE